MMFLEVFRFNIEWNILDIFNQIRSDLLDQIVLFISNGGSAIIILLLLTLFYWSIDTEKGKRIAFISIFSICFNNFFKALFSAKRPFEYQNKEYLNPLPIDKTNATGSSFPSGHSENAGTIYSLMVYENKNKAIKIVSITVCLLVCLSRIYLGVHFPGDIVVGVTLGILTTVILEILLKKFNNPLILYLASIVFFIPTIFFNNVGKDFFRGYGLLVGFVLAYLFDKKFVQYQTSEKVRINFLRYIFGIITLGIIYLGVNYINHTDFVNSNNIILFSVYFVDHTLLAFIGMGLIPFLFKKVKFLN